MSTTIQVDQQVPYAVTLCRKAKDGEKVNIYGHITDLKGQSVSWKDGEKLITEYFKPDSTGNIAQENYFKGLQKLREKGYDFGYKAVGKGNVYKSYFSPYSKNFFKDKPTTYGASRTWKVWDETASHWKTTVQRSFIKKTAVKNMKKILNTLIKIFR